VVKFLGVVGTLVVLAFGTCIGVLSMTPPEYWLAKGCLVGAALGLSLIGLFWAATVVDTDLWLKLGVGLLAVWFSVVGLPLFLALIDAKETRGIISSPLENLATLSDDDLRQRSSSLSNELHKFESDYDPTNPALTPQYKFNLSKERQAEEWREYTNKIIIYYTKRNIEFIRLYSARITSIIAEMQARIPGGPPPVPVLAVPALSGNLAGGAPVSAVADYIVLLASKLP
jgi:hypothetical protein